MPRKIVFSKPVGLKINGSSIGFRGENDTVAICNYFSKDVIVANMEEAALTSHMKDKKHVERYHSDQCIESLMAPTPAPHLIILKISLSRVLSFQ